MRQQEFERLVHQQLPASVRQAAIEHFENCTVCRQHTIQWLTTSPQHLSKSGDTQVDCEGTSAVINESQETATIEFATVRAFHSLATQKLTPGDFAGNERGLSQFPATSASAPLGKLGKYRLLEPLGEGGFGTVFKAQDETIGRIVAIKVLKDHYAISEPRQMLLAEARRASKVQSEFVVQVNSVNRHAGFDYLVLDFIEGQSLSQQMRGGVEPAQAATWVAQIARGLDALHRSDVLHLDIKPSNVLIHSPTNRALLTDIGLDRDEVDVDGERKIRSRGGTPAYMSPEQTRSGIVDERSDIFSLGVMFYELLHGTRPFSGERNQLIHSIQFDAPQPPVRRKRRLPVELLAIANKCLEKQPTARYQSALQVAEDISRWQNHRPISAHPVTKFNRTRLWIRRNWWQLSIIAMALVAFISLYARNLSLAEETQALNREKLTLDRERNNLRYTRSSLRSLTVDMASRLTAVPQADVLRRDLLTTAKDYLDKSLDDYGDIESLQAETHDSHLLLAIIENGLGNVDSAARELSIADRGFQSLASQANLLEQDLYFLTLYYNDRWLASPSDLAPRLEDLKAGVRIADRYCAASKSAEAKFYLASSKVNLGAKLIQNSAYLQGKEMIHQGLQALDTTDFEASRRKLVQSHGLINLIAAYLQQERYVDAVEATAKVDELLGWLHSNQPDRIELKQMSLVQSLNKLKLAERFAAYSIPQRTAVLLQLYQNAAEHCLRSPKVLTTIQHGIQAQDWLLNMQDEEIRPAESKLIFEISNQLTARYEAWLGNVEDGPAKTWQQIARNAYELQVKHYPVEGRQKSHWLERAFELTPIDERLDATLLHIARGYFLDGDVHAGLKPLSQIGEFIELDETETFDLACVYSLGGKASASKEQENNFADLASALLARPDLRVFLINNIETSVLEEQYLPEDSDLHWLYQRNSQLFDFSAHRTE